MPMTRLRPARTLVVSCVAGALLVSAPSAGAAPLSAAAAAAGGTASDPTRTGSAQAGSTRPGSARPNATRSAATPAAVLPATPTPAAAAPGAPTTTAPASRAPAPAVARPGPAAAAPALLLAYGARGSQVRTLQRLLHVKATGRFNKKTRKRVRKVQRRAGLPVTGVVDARTYVAIQAAEARRVAKKKAKAERRKARAERRKAAAAKRRAADRAASRSLPRAGAPAASKRFARAYIRMEYDWGSTQFRCLTQMWERESNWRYWVSNPNGKYHGIPQTSSVQWSKHGLNKSEYMRSPRKQIEVGARYIRSRYGTPCKAWAFWRGHNWY